MTKSRVESLLKATLREAVVRKEFRVARACRELLGEARAEVREHQSLFRYSNFGAFNLSHAGPVGRAVLLLYTANLFESEKCLLDCVEAQDVKLLVIAAARLRSLDLSPLNDTSVIDILKRVCSSSYFIKEDVGAVSRVLPKMNRMRGLSGSRLWNKLVTSVNTMYLRANFIHYLPQDGDKLDFNAAKPEDLYALQLEPLELLRTLPDCKALDNLVTRRPPKSLLPHVEAAMVCIEHAVSWLNNFHLKVFYPLHITYSDLGRNLSREDELLFSTYWNVRVPSTLDRIELCSLLELYAPHSLRRGDVHYLEPEDYDEHKDLFPDMSKKEFKVMRSLRAPYRSKPHELEFERTMHSKAEAQLFLELMRLEPEQYRRLYE